MKYHTLLGQWLCFGKDAVDELDDDFNELLRKRNITLFDNYDGYYEYPSIWNVWPLIRFHAMKHLYRVAHKERDTQALLFQGHHWQNVIDFHWI